MAGNLSLLHHAIKRGYFVIARHLIEQGADLEKTNNLNQSALFHVISKRYAADCSDEYRTNSLNLISLCLTRGAKVNNISANLIQHPNSSWTI